MGAREWRNRYTFFLTPPPCLRYPGLVSLKTTKTGSSLTKKGVRGGSFLAIFLKKGVLGSPGGSFWGVKRSVFGVPGRPCPGGGLLGVLLGVWGYTKQYIIRAFFENAKDDVVT